MTDVVEHRDGADPSTVHTSPGRTGFEPVVVERGITEDRRFEVWADLVASADDAPPTTFRKDVEIKFFDETGAPVVAFKVLRAWPSTYQALTRFDSGADAFPTEQLVLQHDGWILLP